MVSLMNETCDRIVALTQSVFDELGPGLTECLYQKALCQNLRKNGHIVESEVIINVIFDNVTVGFIRADIIVDKSVCIELKSKASLSSADKVQASSYLNHKKELIVCILMNFPPLKRDIESEVISR